MRNVTAIAILNGVLLVSASNALGQDAPVLLNSGSLAQISNVELTPEIFIGSGDLLAISVAGAPEYHYDVRVSPTGGFSANVGQHHTCRALHDTSWKTLLRKDYKNAASSMIRRFQSL